MRTPLSTKRQNFCIQMRGSLSSSTLGSNAYLSLDGSASAQRSATGDVTVKPPCAPLMTDTRVISRAIEFASPHNAESDTVTHCESRESA